MKASIKQFYLSAGIFVVLAVVTALVFRQVPAPEQFYAIGAFGVILSFLTVVWARIPKEDFEGRSWTGPFRRFMKFVFTGIMGLAALFCLGVFVLAL